MALVLKKVVRRGDHIRVTAENDANPGVLLHGSGWVSAMANMTNPQKLAYWRSLVIEDQEEVLYEQ